MVSSTPSWSHRLMRRSLPVVHLALSIALLAHRRLFDARIRTNSTFADTAILLILWEQLTLGLATIFVSANHLDGREMVKFMTWAQGIVTLNPGVAVLIADVNPIFKFHLFLGMTIFLLFPFTRLVHVWSAPVWYLGRRGYQIVRTTRAVAGRPAAPERPCRQVSSQRVRPSHIRCRPREMIEPCASKASGHPHRSSLP